MKDKKRKKKKNTVKHDLCTNSYLEVQFKYKLKKFFLVKNQSLLSDNSH